MKVNQLKIGVILSYVQIVAQMVVNFVFTPLMLRLLGQSEYGLYTTAISTISALSILSFGFSSSYIKKFAEYRSKSDQNAISSLNGLYFIIFTIIGIVSFVCGLIITFNLKAVFANGLNEQELETARTLMLLLIINLAINFPMSVFNSIIGAHERFLFQKLVYMLKIIVCPMMMIPVLLMGFSSVGLVLTTICFNLFADILNIYYCFHKLHVRVRFYGWETGLFKYLFKYTAFIAIGLIVDQINWNIDKVLLGRFRGTSSVAIYSVGHTLFSCYNSIGNSTGNLFTPRIHAIANRHNCNIKESAKDFTEYLIKVGRIQYILIMLICLGFVFFGKFFINLWAGNGYDNAYWVCLILMIPAMISITQSLGVEMQRSLDNHKFRSLFYLFTAICNLSISIYLAQKYGEIGCAIGTGIALIISDGVAMNYYYKKVMFIDVVKFWKNIFYITLAFIPSIIFGICTITFIKPTNIIYYSLEIIIFVLIYISSLYFFAMNNFEKSIVNNTLNKIPFIK